MKYFCTFLNTDVDLTEERETHIHEYHPDIVPFIDRIQDVFLSCDAIHEGNRDPNLILFYKFYNDIFDGKYNVVAIKRNHRSFILTTYLTDVIKAGAMLWKKE
jgi:hypothetical protein